NDQGGRSVSLRLELWATETHYSGGRLNGYRLGYVDLDSLDGGYYYDGLDLRTDYDAPPSGNFYTVLVFTEWNGSEWLIADYHTFSERTDFGGGGGSGGGNPGGGDPWWPFSNPFFTAE